MVDLLFSISEILFIISYLFRDILYLRLITMVGIIGYIIAALMVGLHVEGMKALIAFNGMGLLINFYQVGKLITEKFPILLPDELKEIYKKSFFVMTTNEFYKKIFKISHPKKYLKGELLAKQNEPINDLILIKNGTLEVIRDGQVLTTLGKGFFIGEMSFLTQENATADVRATSDEVECLIWHKNQLYQLEEKNLDLFTKLEQVIGLNLIQKLALPQTPKNKTL